MAYLLKQTEKRKGFQSTDQQTQVLYLLLAVLGLALWLRVWGISYGLPYDFTIDEPHEIVRAFKLGAGEYDWEGFGKGGLYYILFVEYALLYVVYWILGWVANTREFALLFLQDRTVFYLLARLTVALMGTLTCLVIFLIGRRIYDWRVGLGAAFIGATAYQDEMFSHLINVDIGMILAVWTSVLAYLEYENKAEQRWLIAAGALAGVAMAFKAVAVMICPFFLLAIGSRTDRWRYPQQMLKEAGIVLVTALATLTVMAPEWQVGFGSGFYEAFSYLFAKKTALTPYESNGNESIHVVPMLYIAARFKSIFNILFQHYHIPLVISALLGIGLGLWHRHRWDILWAVFIIVFLTLIVIGKRSLPDSAGEAGSWGVPPHYLLPIMPALWLLSSRVLMILSEERRWLTTVGLTCIVVLPVITFVRQDYEWTLPDTRVLAKEWIEANVPSGAKILMDGMRYRFFMSPPLNPSSSTLVRQVDQAAQSETQVSRGVSAKTLVLYREALERVEGPKYDLYSTEWGSAVKDLTYYVQNCFDYVITSSFVSQRYTAPGRREREQFPQSVQFYEHLLTDPRFQNVYSVAPVPWQRTGFTISVYKVIPTCNAYQRNIDDTINREKKIEIQNSALEKLREERAEN